MRPALARRYMIILLLSLVLRAISTPTIGVKQDWLSSKGIDDLYSYSAIMKFDEDEFGANPVEDLSDGQLAALASQAYDEMKAIGRQNAPLTMGVLATNNQIYFASSIRGEDRGHWLRVNDLSRPNALLEAAGRCRLGGTHRKGGRCAEINLFDVYYGYNKNLNLQGTYSRILAWGTADSQPPRVYRPCGDEDKDNGRWGCNTFLRAISNENPKDHLKDENIRAIPANLPKDDRFLDDLEFQTIKTRPINADDYQACAEMKPYDPNNPDG